ncbi:glycosyltransferase family 4 protein [Candidatus Peregrinibacteria bacterium]|nr:glycosyltransferase family 4 protein [Candidatus Peregrinibacteria bacterium]
MAHLLMRNDPVHYALFVRSPDSCWIPADASASYSLYTAPFQNYSLSEQLMFPLVLRHSKSDLLFFPHFNVPLLCPIPFATTIHDLILHRYPNQASALRRASYRMAMRHAVRKARALIAVSKFTAGELARTYGNNARKKTTVIHNAVSDEFCRKSAAECGAVLKKYDLRKPFFLYVGNCKEHKNVQTLINAYDSLKTEDTELALVTGGKEAGNLILRAGVRILRDVSASDLPCLYYFAVAFATASLYEGFGMPVMEAAASGCPVIVTNRGSLPEISPPGSRIVEPTIAAIAEALRDPPRPPNPGKIRTWEEVANQTFVVLRKALDYKLPNRS